MVSFKGKILDRRWRLLLSLIEESASRNPETVEREKILAGWRGKWFTAARV